MNRYKEMMDKQQKTYNSFEGLFFAFSREQLEDNMKKFGVTIYDVCGVGSGGFIIKKDKIEVYRKMLDGFREELINAMQDDSFAEEAFEYELANHEYCVTSDVTDTLAALNLDFDDVMKNAHLREAMIRAIRKVEKYDR